MLIICRGRQLARSRAFPKAWDSVKAEAANVALFRVKSRITVALSGEEPWQESSQGEVLRVLEQRPPLAVLAAWAGRLNTPGGVGDSQTERKPLTLLLSGRKENNQHHKECHQEELGGGFAALTRC